MVLTLDVLLHEAGENNVKIKIIRHALVRSSTREYLLKMILQHKSYVSK